MTTYIESGSKNIYDIKQNVKPNFIYIPIYNSYPLVKKDDYVYINDVVVNNNIPIRSSISGYVKGILNLKNINNELENYLVIENDYREQKRNILKIKNDIYSYNKNELLDLLKEYGFNLILNDIEYLIISTIDNNRYTFVQKAILYNNCEIILETIDVLINIINISKCFIIVNDRDTYLKKEINKYLGSYLNITLVSIPNIYLTMWNKYLNRYLIKKRIIKKNKKITTCNVEIINYMYRALKFGEFATEKIISLNSNKYGSNVNINVKLYSNLNDLITLFNLNNDISLINGGTLTGSKIKSKNIIITKDITGISFVKNDFKQTTKCINCGLCSKVCPEKLHPKLIMENIDNKCINKMHLDKCINCGLCSYYCPSKIELNEYVKLAKKKITNYEK